MLSKFFETLQKAFTAPSEQDNLDAFIAAQHPTSVTDVEYWINVYDRRQHAARSNNFYQYND